MIGVASREREARVAEKRTVRSPRAEVKAWRTARLRRIDTSCKHPRCERLLTEERRHPRLLAVEGVAVGGGGGWVGVEAFR